MNSSSSAENASVTAMESRRQYAAVREASSRLSFASSFGRSAPPPMPNSPPRQSVRLNTGRISDTPATIYGSFV